MAIPSMMRVQAVEQPKMGRRLRRPQHTFQLRTRPYQIQPFMLAPVIPGETMQNLLLQSTVISDPIKNRMCGWWKEYYWFYVKITDLDDREEFEQMVLRADWDKSAVTINADALKYYFYADATHEQIPWGQLCAKRVVEEYFRDEGEAWDVATLDGLPLARESGGRGFWQSASNEADVTFGDVSISTAGDNAFTLGEFDEARRQFELLRQGMAVDMTYEDFLRSFGIRAPDKEKPHRPELIRYAREWQMPVSAIDPTDGSAASAVTWKFTERADKDRFFREPGFICGYTVTRPKIYFSRQEGVGASMLDNVFAWLPALMSDDPNTSLKLIPDGAAPIGDVTDANGVWIDVKDLLLYGDQFVNYALSDTESNFVALPTAAMQKRYVSSADVDALFASASPANQIREDGICTLNIAGRQVDTSS